MLSEKATKIAKLKYFQKGEDWEQLCWRVAHYISGAEKEEERYEWATKFYQLIYNKYFIPGGRTLANAGTEIKNLNNCYVLPVEDSRESIYGTLKDAAELFAWGGGIGYNFSELREEGAEIKTTGGKASGPLSFMSLFDQTGEVIAQASRRGAQIGILDIDHPDIEKFINFKSTPNSRNKRLMDEYLRNLHLANLDRSGKKYFKVLEKTLQDDQLSHFNISVLVNDYFMRCVEKDLEFNLVSRTKYEITKRLRARDLLKQVSQMAWESGDPGILFYTRTNEDNMCPYYGELKATNPCVTGDTKILTVYDGGVPIKDLVGQDILVYTWNPKTKLPEVGIMYNIRKTRENSELVEVGFDSGLKLKCTPDHNLYTFRGNKIQVKNLKVGQSIRAFSMSVHKDNHIRVHGFVNGRPRHQYISRMIWEYFNGKIPKELILHHKNFKEQDNRLENFELLTISEHNRVHYNSRKAKGFHGRNHKVTSIKYLNEKEDVYNGIVDNTHSYIIADDIPVAGFASGIVSANCGEIPLLPYEPCCLGSINLHEFYKDGKIDFELLEFVIRTSIRFLDDVQELSFTPIEKVNEVSKGFRRLGLGVMGFADLLSELNIEYGSQQSIELAEFLSWFLSFFSWLESIELAKEKGAFPYYNKDNVNFHVVEKILNSKFNPHKFNIGQIKETGVRNVSVTSVAPTGTIALLCDVNSGIEPFFALAYRRNITEGIGNIEKDFIIEINPILFRRLKELNYSNEDIEEIKKFVLETGKLSGCPKILEKDFSGFMTSSEISPYQHVDVQAAWQKYITNAVSKTINCPQEITPEEIENIFIYAWNDGVKGITIYRDKSKTFQILNVGV